jgi:hypothetical protein
MEHIECFDDPETVCDKFNYYLSEYFNCKVSLDTLGLEITLPSIFKTYYNDFGNDEQILRFIWHWKDNTDYTIDEILKVSKTKLQIKYDNNVYSQ